jgi:hypothetical protein
MITTVLSGLAVGGIGFTLNFLRKLDLRITRIEVILRTKHNVALALENED